MSRSQELLGRSTGPESHPAKQATEQEAAMHRFASEPAGNGLTSEQHLHISWRAILAGIVVALAVDVLLSLLGFAVGLTAFEPVAGVVKNVGPGTGIWFIITPNPS